MKKVALLIVFLAITLVYTSKFFIESYLPQGTIILDTKGRGRLGNQLFQYAAAYALAKQTDSKFYLLVDEHVDKPSYVMPTEGEYALKDLNIPVENIIYKNYFNKIYFKLLEDHDNKLFSYLRKKLNIKKVEYVNENNFFSIAKTKNDKILIIKDWFESPIFFQDYKEELLEQFSFNKLDTKKLQPIVNDVSSKNSICVHVRRGDMKPGSTHRYTSINYQKQAMKLSEELIENPSFFIFSDDIEAVKQELETKENIKFVDAHSPTEDLYLMSQCANNIITRSSFSWWAAYLNQNNSLVIAPYVPYNGEFYFSEVQNAELRYNRKALAARTYPKDWVLLDENAQNLVEVAQEYIPNEALRNEILAGYKSREFSIYAGNGVQLEICKGKGDFRSNLCVLNNKLPNNMPTVVTAYYSIKSKFNHSTYTEWAENFLQIPFNLVVYTDKGNASWIKKLRGDLPMVLIEKSLEEFEAYKLKDKYENFAERDQERNPKTGDKYHSAELYMIWAEKIKFVNDAIKLNPYAANFFVWCDIGVFRDKKYIQNNYTNDKFMIQDKMSIVMIEDIKDQDLKAGFVNSSTTDGAQGGIAVGDIRAWQIYDYLYDLTRKDLMDKDILSGKDQTVITTMVIRYPKIFNLIYQDPRDSGNRWWYGLIYHSNRLITADSDER